MAYNYGGFGGNAHTYGGDLQDYNQRNRYAVDRYGGDGTFGVYSGDRDARDYNVASYGRNQGGYGGGNPNAYRTETYEYSTRQPQYGRVSTGVYGVPSYGNVGRDYEREQRITSKSRRSAGVFGGGSSSRKYQDQDRSYSKYRNKRDASTSSSSSSDDDNREGLGERIGNKIKGVFGYGPDANNNNNNREGQYGNNDQYNNNYSSSSRRADKYNTKSYNTGSYKNAEHGGSYFGGNGDDKIVSLRGRREIAPSHVSEETPGSKQLVWQVNAQGFDLDNIKVADAGNNKVEITGHAEEVGPHFRRTKQFTRVITLPEGSNAKEVKSRISGRGLLTISVPYTGKGLSNYGTRELQLGQGSVHGTSGSRGATGNTTSSYGSSGANTGGQYQQTSTQQTTRSTTNA